MKYLCLGYRDRAKMDAVPAPEMKAILRTWVSSVQELNQCSGTLLHHALQRDVTTLRASRGEITVTDGPCGETREEIASFFVIEARDLNEAIRVASLHPSARMGEDLGWRIEIRAVGEFKPD